MEQKIHETRIDFVRGELLQMLFSRHWIMHLEACEKICKKNFEHVVFFIKNGGVIKITSVQFLWRSKVTNYGLWKSYFMYNFPTSCSNG